jgi:TPR repeat protein
VRRLFDGRGDKYTDAEEIFRQGKEPGGAVLDGLQSTNNGEYWVHAMNKRRIGIGGIIILMIAVGVWVLMPTHSASTVRKLVLATTPPLVPVATVSPETDSKKVSAGSDLWTRLSPDVAARNGRRYGFAWILRQLGATEDQLNRLADLDIAGVIAELKEKARAGDAASINVLGEIALQNCQLGRDDVTVESFVASQIRDVQAVPAIDAAWFTGVMRNDEIFDKAVHAACAQVDVNEVMSWVTSRANKGDGASLWLMFRDANNMTEMQQRLRDAAAAGFPQAQFELAWGILHGQEGAAGTGAAKVSAGDMLTASQGQLPRSEAQLATCEYSGCDGVPVDVNAAIKHAREAAQRGSPEAMVYIGPHLPAGQLDPNEVAAWGLIQASLQQAGCGGNGFSVREMKSISSTLNANNISAQARTLAEQYWQDHGAQMMANIGCTP